MILGTVRNRSPRVTLSLPGPGAVLDVSFHVDTGYEGELALPRRLAGQVELGGIERRIIALADGSLAAVGRGLAMIEWNDEEREVEVLIMDGNPLLGMLMLEGFHYHMEATEGGEILIEEL